MYPAFLVGAYLYTNKVIETKCWSIFLVSLPIYLIFFSFNDYEMFSYPVLRLHRLLSSPDLGTYLSVQAYIIGMGIFGSLSVISLFIGLGQLLPNSKVGEFMSSCGSKTLGIYLV